MANWHRDVARRKAREKLQRAQERRDAERWEKMIKGLRLKDERQERAFKKSGCETMEEFLELQRAEREARELEQAEREQRQRDYCAGFVETPAGLPNAQELANALTSIHAGGRPVRLPALLIESGRTDDRAEAVRLCKTQLGRDLAEALRELHWYRRRVRGIFEWVPPERKGGE